MSATIAKQLMRLGAIAVLWCGVAAPSCAAAVSAKINPSVDPDTARFTRIDTSRGLAQNTVLAINEDRFGFVWVASQNGLTRLDGDEAVVYRPKVEGSGGLSDNFISSLAVDRRGVLWIGTLEGLNLYDPISDWFTLVKAEEGRADRLASDEVRALLVAADGALWVGTERGLSRMQLGDARPDANGAGIGEVQTWSTASGAPMEMLEQRFAALAAAPDGRVWAGSMRGLYEWSPALNRLQRLTDTPFGRGQIRALLYDTHGRLWVSVGRLGVFVRETDDGPWKQVKSDGQTLESVLEMGEVHAMLQRRSGVIWLGTDRGAVRLDVDDPDDLKASKFRHHRHDKASIGGGRIAALFEDSHDNLWLGSWNGGASALRESGNLLESYTPDLPMLSGMDNPASVSLLGMGERLWVGSGDGAYFFHLGRRELRWVPDTGRLVFYSAALVGDRFWAGTGRGVLSAPLGADTVEPEPLPRIMERSIVRRMLVDEGKVWAVADPTGLVLLDLDTKSIIKNIAFDRQVTFIKRASEEWVLVGSYGGLYWFDNEGNERYVHGLAKPGEQQDPDLLPMAPMDLHVDREGTVWLATNGAGLARVDLAAGEQPKQARFTFFLDDAGPDNGMLKSLLEDDEGRLWMSTTRGISMFDPRASRFENFGAWAGALESDYINASAAKLADGRLSFGGMDGFTVFDPERVVSRPRLAPTAPRIVDVEWGEVRDPLRLAELNGAFRHAALGDGVLAVPAEASRSLTFRFASMDPVSKARPEFQYRLDPFDVDWKTSSSERRLASYTNLAPGSYRLRVRTQQQQMPWSPERHLDLRIEAYWWQTFWARLLGAVLLAALVSGAYSLRMRQLSEQRRRLEALVATRTADLEDRSRALEEQRNRAQQAFDALQTTQQELIRSEKMAALGQLVAGVAHEVNTPLGVAITAATHLRDSERLVAKKLASGELRKSDLQLFMETAEESTSMIERNLDRAGQLITNFKQVSVDRTSDGRRNFKLRPFLAEVLQSLELMWKRRAISMEVSCADDLELDSFPGALGQIITNLTQNAVLHAFGEEGEGRMRIAAVRVGTDRVLIEFADNGCGIPSADLVRVFEPFFTTRRSQGGTGLGLNIIYNLVTQKLGGTIRVDSETGQGTRFVMELPQQAPE